MPTTAASKTPLTVFQLRADPKLIQQVKALAEERGVSTNRFLVDAVKTALRLEKEREWREGFEAMGRDPETDAEYLLPAAREVIFGR